MISVRTHQFYNTEKSQRLITFQAIWDNRSVFHSATNDYDTLGDRVGHRAVGIGEKPYLDPQSQSRTVALSKN
jgi:hypothetical protein